MVLSVVQLVALLLLSAIFRMRFDKCEFFSLRWWACLSAEMGFLLAAVSLVCALVGGFGSYTDHIHLSHIFELIGIAGAALALVLERRA